jgi:hypothetical protein
MNKLHLHIILLILSALFLVPAGTASAASFTKGDKMGTAASLTLDAIAAYRDGIKEEKNLQDAAKKLAQDQIMSWIMESMKSSSKDPLDELLDKDPYLLANIKKKFDEARETFDLVDKVSMALANGEYVDALFMAADGPVKELKLPVLQALWETIKITYESHKLVVQTGAERDLDALYGRVASDRYLLGSKEPGSDQPKQIPETVESADYFFNRYIITDDGIRSAMKSYVKIVIGDEWPEQDWNE